MEFIPVAEETGLILSLGEWILRKACAQNKIWHDAGYEHLCIGVNFSSRQFQHQDIPGLIKSVLNETGMPAHSLNVEITESIAMESRSIKILNELTDMGIKTSIDDFGTGYSSLGSLKQFPIDTIKIDRSFVKEIALDPNVETIVKAIIAMAHSLNMKVVAEGVETKEQQDFLQSNRCNELQGYLFSPPVTEDKFITLLEKGMQSIPGTPAKKVPSGTI
jgi:EAL domain-containing protein (putative c-di-GMP-specific phosphodiesterase class I)